MSRNLKKDYLRKLANIETANGFKVDLANYIYNPSYEYDYPTLKKVVSEDAEKVELIEVQYFKYYNGSGEYLIKEYAMPNNKDAWNIARNVKEKVVEASNRFNLTKLIQLAETV